MKKNNSERININEIIIPEDFKKKAPGKRKMNMKIAYFEKNGEYNSPIVLNKSNVLIDGYTSYLIAKRYGFKNVRIERG